jgi:hypothetical protein
MQLIELGYRLKIACEVHDLNRTAWEGKADLRKEITADTVRTFQSGDFLSGTDYNCQ